MSFAYFLIGVADSEEVIPIEDVISKKVVEKKLLGFQNKQNSLEGENPIHEPQLTK